MTPPGPFEMLLIWLLALGVLVPSLLPSRGAMARFAAETDPARRLAGFRRLFFFSLVLHGGVGLFLVDRLRGAVFIRYLPAEFIWIRYSILDALPALATGAAIGTVLGLGLALLIRRRLRRAPVPAPGSYRDRIRPLIPRTAAERVWAALISINAGISEELFFRLALPLLFLTVTGNVWWAFGAALATFSLVHIYQGVLGLLVTFALGLALALVYLGTGQLWIAMALHALIDLRVLVLGPWLRDRQARAAA